MSFKDCVLSLFLCILLISIDFAAARKKKPTKEEDCDVCVAVVKKFTATLSDDVKSKPEKIETAFKKYCKSLKDKEERFCYYIGGLETSATYILGTMSRPISNHFPPLKICEKLWEADNQICDLKNEKPIDFADFSFKKAKVRDLKKILSDWGEENVCKGCSEKSEFVRAVKQLLPKYAPEAAKLLEEKEEL